MISKKAEKLSKDYRRRTLPEDLALAKVTSGEIRPGPYNILPVLCTMHRAKTSVYVLLSSFLLRIPDDKHMGVMNWLLPYNERTALTVCKLLVSLGWDGRVWPDDAGWPTGTEADGLRQVLKGQNLTATLTFPPDPKNGNFCLRQEVLRSNADFALCPDVDDGAREPTPEHLEKLRQLAIDPSIFGMGGL
jgi:hypothetical protein